MRFLVVGAGALGGYYGARLIEAGEDVTFLLRPRRFAEVQQNGLNVYSPFGDLHLKPSILTSETIKAPFDVVMVGCKAYDLPQAMEAMAPAVGPQTMILPLLNGMRHLDTLKQRFGASCVLGGLCRISAALDAQGAIQHLNNLHLLSYGELDGSNSPRIQALNAALAKVRFEAHLASDIVQEMWEKWVLIATLAGVTCLMRASIGDILAAGAGDVAIGMLDECSAIAAHNGHAPSEDAIGRIRGVLSAPGSTLTASMFKDVERGATTEADHIVGELLRHAPGDAHDFPLLRLANAHLLAYEIRRAQNTANK